jgi:hypothetical protein
MTLGSDGVTANIIDSADSSSLCAAGTENYTPCIDVNASTLNAAANQVCITQQGMSADNDRFNIQCTDLYQATGASGSLPVSGELYILSGGGGTGAEGQTSVDYSHTAVFGLTVPANFTYTSDSGVFLTQAAPEPGTVVLLALGLAGTLTLRRRRV